jgi:leucine dehydrogenase
VSTADLLGSADHEQVLVARDREAGTTLLVAIHSTRLGPAHGGLRRVAYASFDAALRDVLALAQAMTWKCALAGVPAGGGKAVLIDHPGLDRAAAYRFAGRTVEQLGGRYFTGPDAGTGAADLELVAERTKFVAVDRDGGPGDLAGATATGVAAAIAAVAARLGRALRGLHVVVQGAGEVGTALCERLAAAGVRLTVADVVPARAAAAAQRFGAAVVAPDRVASVACDVFAPCALGGVLTADVAAALPARAVCGAANNVLADDAAAHVLHERGVLVVPDFVANAGALILGATWHLTGQRAPIDRVQRIGSTVAELLERAAREDVPPPLLALQVARERVARGPSPAHDGRR